MTLAELPKRGITRIALAAPGFAADCLETLEEIAIRGRDTFLAAGGKDFAYLPCLNDGGPGMAMLRSLIERELEAGPATHKARSIRGIRRETEMARVAIVTGGTRGIGEAISIALQKEGVTVAANYAGNEEKARAFSERTGIPSYKFDVLRFRRLRHGGRPDRKRSRPGRRADQQCRRHPRRHHEADEPRHVGTM